MGNGKIFSSGYRFFEGDVRTAVLDDNGKLSTFDNGLTVYESWGDYVKEVLEEKPCKGTEAEILEQLGMLLGRHEAITVDAGETRVSKRPKAVQQQIDEEETQQENTDMATATKAVAKKAAPVKKAVAAKAEVVQNPCRCGCGTMVNKSFAPGHDARYHGWMKKIADGRMKFNEVNAVAQKNLKADGVKQGVAAA